MTTTTLNQQIAACRNIFSDIELLVAQAAPTQDFLSLVTLYKHKFAQLGSLQVATVTHGGAGDVHPIPEVHTTSSDIAHVKVVDNDSTCFEINFGQYNGEWIVGIDGPVESISLSLRTLAPLISALQMLETHKNN